MAIDLDGFAVLSAIAAHPGSFAGIRPAVTKAAQDLVVKQIKTKAITLDAVRGLRTLLGREQFGLIVDGMSDANVKSLLSKLDKYHPELKASEPRWRRDHLRALAKGDVEPAERLAGTAKKTKQAKAAAPTRKEPGLRSEAMEVFRQSFGKSRRD